MKPSTRRQCPERGEWKKTSHGLADGGGGRFDRRLGGATVASGWSDMSRCDHESLGVARRSGRTRPLDRRGAVPGRAGLRPEDGAVRRSRVSVGETVRTADVAPGPRRIALHYLRGNSPAPRTYARSEGSLSGPSPDCVEIRLQALPDPVLLVALECVEFSADSVLELNKMGVQLPMNPAAMRIDLLRRLFGRLEDAHQPTLTVALHPRTVLPVFRYMTRSPTLSARRRRDSHPFSLIVGLAARQHSKGPPSTPRSTAVTRRD
jgi:hypothetical protein